jgi:hypothetical protein
LGAASLPDSLDGSSGAWGRGGSISERLCDRDLDGPLGLAYVSCDGDLCLVTETSVETGVKSIENVADVVRRKNPLYIVVLVRRQNPLYIVVLRWKVVRGRGMEVAASQSCCIYILSLRV